MATLSLTRLGSPLKKQKKIQLKQKAKTTEYIMQSPSNGDVVLCLDLKSVTFIYLNSVTTHPVNLQMETLANNKA